MSGFVGIINFDRAPVDQAVLHSMMESIAYRGPDAQALWIDGHVGMGHTLHRNTYESINEQQPLTFDDEVVIVLDGRIDVRNELIPLLRAHGRQFENNTPDVNLVLHAYEAFGEDCLRYLQGDFSFAIWDKRLQRLLCARDHFGLRVLYYARIGSTFIFSNEIRAIRQHPAVLDALNDIAIADFLMLGRNTWLQKDQTPFADIMRLPPAHRLIATPQSFRVGQYWDFPLDSPMLDYSSEEDYLEHYRET